MKYYAISMIAIMVMGIFLAGCTQYSGNAPVSPAVPITTPPTPEPATPLPTAAVMNPPEQVVTVVHQISLLKNVKDTDLLFTLQVPVEWDISTYRENTADPEVMLYRTSLVADNVFYLYTYTVSRSQDQAYRDQFRKWSPAPAETTVTINRITYDRFESTSPGMTRVAYVARKSSANERGYASVIVFTANDSNRFEKDDYERVVSSFRYFTAAEAGTLPGTEIERVNPPSMVSGSASSGKAGSSESVVSTGCSKCGVS